MKIKTGTKLFAGLGVILVMVVIMAGVFYLSMKNVEATKAEVLQMADLDTFFSERVVDHLKWMDGLSSGLFIQGKEFQGQIDPDQCNLGKWMKTFKPYSNEIAGPFNRLDEPHRKLHEAAARVISNVKEGHKEKAHEIFVSEIIPAVTTVQENLNTMKGILKKDEEAKNIQLKAAISQANALDMGLAIFIISFGTCRRHNLCQRYQQWDHETD